MEQKKGHQAVFGIYQAESAINTAIDRLKVAGFQTNDISVLMPSKDSGQELRLKKRSKLSMGAISGMVIGAVLGAFSGWMASKGAVPDGELPSVFVLAGSTMAATEGTILGALIFGVLGALIGLAQPEYEAKRYLGNAKTSGGLLSVHTEDSLKKRQAKAILKASGARDVAAEMEKFEKTEKPDQIHWAP
jgi:uncharacterized membrane protein